MLFNIMVATQIAENFKGADIDLPKIKNLVNAVCNRFGISKATVSIAIVGDNEIRKANRKFLNRDSATDCLSFDLSDDDTAEKSFELLVNAQKAIGEAKRRGHSSQAELALYITHGLLHNLGFDDSKPAEAQKMHDTENEILMQNDFGLVYNSS